MDKDQIEARAYLRELMRITGKQPATLAKEVGLSPSTLTRFYNNENVKHTISRRSISRLEEKFGLQFPGNSLSVLRPTIPVVGFIGAGEQIFPVDDVTPGSGIEYVDAPPGADPESVAVIVKGDSMFPAFWDGDILIFVRDVPFDRSVCLYNECIVKVKDGPTYVKQISPGSSQSTYNLVSYNAPTIIDAELEWAAPVQFQDKRRRTSKPRKAR